MEAVHETAAAHVGVHTERIDETETKSCEF